MLDEDLSEHSESRRHVEAKLLHRLLMAGPAHEVYKKLSERTEAHDHIDFVLENALLDRDDPLITLGIAKFCKESGVASRVFDLSSGDDDESRLIRKALISNHLLNDVPASYFSLPSYFLEKGNYKNFNDSFQELIAYLKKIRDSDDFYDIFENRNAIAFCRKIIVAYEQGVIKGNYDFLGLIIKGLSIWLSKNYRNINNEDAGYEFAYKAIYGDPDEDFDWNGTKYPLHYYICKLPDEAFLPESLNITNWGSIFSLLRYLRCFVRGVFDFQRIKRIADRLKEADREQDFYSKNEGNGHLSQVDLVTKYMVMASHGWELEELLSSSEIAFRCAAYSVGRLSKSDIERGYKKDRAIFFESVADNDRFWKDNEAVAVASNLYYDYTRGTRESTRYDYLMFSMFNRKNEERMEKEYEEERLAVKEQ